MYAILIPSYIRNDWQLFHLDLTIMSAMAQTKKSHILISISSAKKYISDTKKFIKKYKDATNVHFYYSDKRLHQLENLQKLSRVPLIRKCKYVLFLDDDDLYEYNRVFEMTKNSKYKCICDYADGSFSIGEYWSYAVKPEIFIRFFSLMKNHQELFKNNYADVLLLLYLNKYMDKVLTKRYYIKMANPGSVMRTYKKNTYEYVWDALSAEDSRALLKNKKMKKILNLFMSDKDILNIKYVPRK